MQADGVTPLYVASCNGHVECVRALLDRGAAIDRATVGYLYFYVYCRGCLLKAPRETIRLHGNSSGALGCHVVELGAIGGHRTPLPCMLH